MQVINSVFGTKEAKKFLFPVFYNPRIGEYKDTQARCLALRVLTSYLSHYTASARVKGGPGMSKKYSFRNIMSEGSSKILPELLYEKGVYHLLYQISRANV